MTRRYWLAAPLLSPLAACRRPAALPDLFPPVVAGAWRRTGLRTVASSDAPDPVPRTAIERLEIATYEGPGKLEARAYQLDSPAVALDLAQRWRPSADTVFFFRDQYFIVIRWDQAGRKQLEAFVRELQNRLGRPRERSEER